MATYSINPSTAYYSTFLGNLDPNLFLVQVPNNTSQLIYPKHLRDAVFTIWDNMSFKRVAATGSSVNYIGIGGTDHKNEYQLGANGLKVFLGKPQLAGNDILNANLIEYNSANPSYPDADVIVYNFKPDDYAGGGTVSANQQFTKMLFLAGDNTNNLFLTAPYIQAQQNISGTAIDMTIFNEGGKITIDSDVELVIGSPDTKITLMAGTGSTGIATLPGGIHGDVQLNVDNCEFGYVDSTGASLGNVLIMGASNSPYWGSLSINSVFTLNQVLTAGNISDGKDLIISGTDSLYINGATGMGIYYDTIEYKISAPSDTIKISGNKFILDIPTNGNNKALYTNGSGEAYWGTQSNAVAGGADTNVQYNSLGSFAGSNLFKWNSITSSLNINNSGGTASVSIKANVGGGLYLNTNGVDKALVVNDGSYDVFKISDTNNIILFDTGNNNSIVFGGNDVKRKYTITGNGEHISYFSSGAREFKQEYWTDGDQIGSIISHSPQDNMGMFIGVLKELDSPLYLGSFDTGFNYDASMILYPSLVASYGFIGRTESKTILFGDGDKTTANPEELLEDSEIRRSIGINITPKLDFHLYGVRGITPEARVLEALESGGYSLLEIKSSYITLNNTIDDGRTIYRWGANGSKVTAFGTTIEVWNRTGGNITIGTLNGDLTVSYTPLSKNIYFPELGDGASYSTFTWTTGTMLRFVYLSCANLATGGDMYTKLNTISAASLISEGGVWYKVD